MTALSATTRRLVQERAGGRCEYCRMRESWEPFHTYHVEHIISRQHGGGSEPGNLALSCHHCNFLKGPNLSSRDPDTATTTELFHPRRDEWSGHFKLEGARITGLTPAGRTTVFLLDMNAPQRVELRETNAAEF